VRQRRRLDERLGDLSIWQRKGSCQYMLRQNRAAEREGGLGEAVIRRGIKLGVVVPLGERNSASLNQFVAVLCWSSCRRAGARPLWDRRP